MIDRNFLKRSIAIRRVLNASAMTRRCQHLMTLPEGAASGRNPESCCLLHGQNRMVWRITIKFNVRAMNPSRLNDPQPGGGFRIPRVVTQLQRNNCSVARNRVLTRCQKNSAPSCRRRKAPTMACRTATKTSPRRANAARDFFGGPYTCLA